MELLKCKTPWGKQILHQQKSHRQMPDLQTPKQQATPAPTFLTVWMQMRWPNVSLLWSGTVPFFLLCSTSSLTFAPSVPILVLNWFKLPNQWKTIGFALGGCTGSAVSCNCNPKASSKAGLASAWQKAQLEGCGTLSDSPPHQRCCKALCPA